ncbi:hypothetical protein ACP70R_018992 [Stipagrostis hirtigluma subsp. patula]
MTDGRSWMYTGRRSRDDISDEWMQKTTEFVDRAFSGDTQDRVLCPCNYCGNSRPQMRNTMVSHLCRHGFCSDYEVWVCHGETAQTRADTVRRRIEETNDQETDRMDDMIDDVREAYVSADEEEEPEPTAQAFFKMLSASSQPLHGHTKVSQLDAITRLLAVKSQFGITISGFDAMLSVICMLLPQEHKLPPNLYEAKKFLSVLNMPYEKIDVCPKNCMLFRKENANKDHCDKCGQCRYVEVQGSDGQKKQLNVAVKQWREQFVSKEFRSPNGIIGLLIRRNYPGIVTYKGSQVAAHKFDHYRVVPEPTPNSTQQPTSALQKIETKFWHYFKWADGKEAAAKRVVRNVIKKLVPNAFYEARLQSIITYHRYVLKAKISRSEARKEYPQVEEYMKAITQRLQIDLPQPPRPQPRRVAVSHQATSNSVVSQIPQDAAPGLSNGPSNACSG